MRKRIFAGDIRCHIIFVVALCAAGIAWVTIQGCGEEEAEPPIAVKPNSAVSSGEMKVPETVAAAPKAPGVGQPSVKAVGYYKDWKLTKPLSGTVASGTTFWIKVMFSEPMKHVAADDKTARPILYYKIDKELTRFRVAKHGASGEDFVSGDAKPLKNGTDDYICKYTVPKEAVGTFTVAVGRQSTDKDGNLLPTFYTHKEKLPIVPKDTVSPTVLSVTYYLDSTRNLKVNPTTEFVSEGTDIYTEVVFSEPVTPSITYTSGNNVDRRYTLSKQYFGIHRHDTYKPTDPTGNSFLCRSTARKNTFSVTVTAETDDLAGNRLAKSVIAPTLVVRPRVPDTGTVIPTDPSVKIAVIPTIIDERSIVGRISIPGIGERVKHRIEAQPVVGAIVTIVSGPRSGEQIMTNQNGQYLFRNVEGGRLHLRVEKVGFEPKEVTVHKSGPTQMSDGTTSKFYKGPQNTPGTILLGHRWPDEVRFILERTKAVDDLLFVRVSFPVNWGGQYSDGVAMLHTKNVGGIANILGVIAHEIAHAHQQAVIPLNSRGRFDEISKWENTPEARAYAGAQRKDWGQFGKAKYETIGYSANLKENAAEFCAYFWSIGRWNRDIHSDLKQVAPNRLKWAQTWLEKQ
ncbi:MAG: carboxypeptidase-like regulatory domain-containing protein [Candidatus Poribacteria bacterium]|nr:carboxypeptidase-like regulatory domain-containing protein [Candidatus Poribacteria bacterium]